jgi:calcineurin-like phosphoesterase family protein
MNQKIFFMPGQYVGHINIIRFSECLFALVDKTDVELIKRWNEKVNSRDIVCKRFPEILLFPEIPKNF